MAHNYCTEAGVRDYLPASLPDEVNSAAILTAIEKSGRKTDGILSKFSLAYESGTQRFPEISSDPATPILIEDANEKLAAAWIFRHKLKLVNRRNNELDQAKLLSNEAYATFDKIIAGEYELILDGAALTQESSVYHTHENETPKITQDEMDTFDR